VRYAWRARQGRPAPFVEIRGRAEDGALIEWNDQAMGELEVRGPWVAGAYYPGDEAPDRWTDDGWFRTGDIVTIGPSGCLTIQDRAKDLVKSGGEWISTVALESALVEHPGVAEAVVVAVPHARWGERPLAVIVPRPGCAPTIEDLRAHLAPRVARWWLPDAVVHVESLPRTGTGKYQKHIVRAAYKDYFAAASVASDVGVRV
jgi:fatty-acyl-CoA synthase